MSFRHTGRPVLGVVPLHQGPSVSPRRDSVSFKDGLIEDRIPAGEHVDIAVVDLPHISNFTDFDPLRIEPDVRLRIVRNSEELGEPDAVILPGSKKRHRRSFPPSRPTAWRMGSLNWPCGAGPKSSGSAAASRSWERKSPTPSGSNPRAGRAMAGLGTLPARTTLAREKNIDPRHRVPHRFRMRGEGLRNPPRPKPKQVIFAR